MTMSSTYVALPVIRRGSSLRLSACPTKPLPPGRVSSTMLMSSPPRLRRRARRLRDLDRLPLGCPCASRGRPHRLDDVVVARAAAEVSLEGGADLLLARVGVPRQQVRRGHDHPRGAVAALQRVVFPERLLHEMQGVAGAEPLDGRHLAAVGL